MKKITPHHPFVTNPVKAASRVTISSFMIGSLFFILTTIIVSNPGNFSIYAIYQLVLAIPLLYVSSLAYSKVGYWKEYKHWETFGWISNNTGNLFVINAIGLVAMKVDWILALLYFIVFLFLMTIYSLINITINPVVFKQKLFKFIFLVIVVFLGGIVPLFK